MHIQADDKHIEIAFWILPDTLEELLATSVLGRIWASSIFKAGESWAAAKPILVTFEKRGLSPTLGGLADTTAELPNATIVKHRNEQNY